MLGQLFFKAGFGEANIITIFILGVLVISNQTRGRFYGAVSSFIGVMSFNFLFTEPRFTFNADDPGYIVTFFIMLIAAFVTSTLTTKVKSQANLSAIIAYRTNVLLDLSRDLERCNDIDLSLIHI